MGVCTSKRADYATAIVEMIEPHHTLISSMVAATASTRRSNWSVLFHKDWMQAHRL
jgi:hypothetical protein